MCVDQLSKDAQFKSGLMEYPDHATIVRRAHLIELSAPAAVSQSICDLVTIICGDIYEALLLFRKALRLENNRGGFEMMELVID